MSWKHKGQEINLTDQGKFVSHVDGDTLIDESLHGVEKKIDVFLRGKFRGKRVKVFVRHWDKFIKADVNSRGADRYGAAFWAVYDNGRRAKEDLRDIYRNDPTGIKEYEKLRREIGKLQKEADQLLDTLRYTEEELMKEMGIAPESKT